MNRERAVKLFWEFLKAAKQELESEGIEVKLRFAQKKEEPFDLSWLAR
jgi:hypothetical protein